MLVDFGRLVYDFDVVTSEVLDLVVASCNVDISSVVKLVVKGFVDGAIDVTVGVVSAISVLK